MFNCLDTSFCHLVTNKLWNIRQNLNLITHRLILAYLAILEDISPICFCREANTGVLQSRMI